MSKAVHRTLEAKLATLDGPEWDSSDEETPVVPLENKKQKKQTGTKQQKDKKQKKLVTKKKSLDSRVIYLGHLPPNFDEPEIKGFLSQFGHVTRLKLSRSRKTANPRGFAFCEFADPQVAAIVAETMSGYLLSQKRLVCHIVENARPNLFDGHDRVFNKVDWTARHRDQVNKTRSAEAMSRITRRLLAREKKKRETLKAMGIDYDFPGYQASSTETANNTVSDQDNVEETKEKRKRRKGDGEVEEAVEKPTAKKHKESLDSSSSEKEDSKRKGTLRSHDSSLEKTASKHKDSNVALASVEKKQSKRTDSSDESLGKSTKKELTTSVHGSDASLGRVEKKQSKLKGPDASLGNAAKKQPERKGPDASLESVEKKQSKLKGPDASLGNAAKKQPERKGLDVSLESVEKRQSKRKSSKDTLVDNIDVTPKKKQTKDVVAMTEVKKKKSSKKRRIST